MTLQYAVQTYQYVCAVYQQYTDLYLDSHINPTNILRWVNAERFAITAGGSWTNRRTSNG